MIGFCFCDGHRSSVIDPLLRGVGARARAGPMRFYDDPRVTEQNLQSSPFTSPPHLLNIIYSLAVEQWVDADHAVVIHRLPWHNYDCELPHLFAQQLFKVGGPSQRRNYNTW